MSTPAASVTLNHSRAAQIVPRGTFPQQSGASWIDQTARGFGTDRKTLLLLGLAGLVGGYLLNDGIKATRRALKRSARRTRSFAAGLATPRNLIIAGTAVLGLGAAYWYYRKHYAADAASSQVAARRINVPIAKPAPKQQQPTRPA